MKPKNSELKRLHKTEMHKREESGDKEKGHIPFVHLFSMGFVICLLFASIGVVRAADYYVATWGSDSNSGTSLDFPWQHPSYAAQQAVAGDTIYLVDGTWYNEQVVFANSGTATHPIVMTAYNGTPTLDGVNDTLLGIRMVSKKHIKITNLRIINYLEGVYPSQGSSDIEISNNYIDTKGHTVEFDNQNITIHNNTLIARSWSAVSTMKHNYNTTYSNNTVLKSGWNGLTLNYAHDSIAYNNDVANIYHNGMQISAGSTNCAFKNNTVHDISDNGYYITWDGSNPDTKILNAIVEDCIAYDVEARGIALDGAINTTIRRFKSNTTATYGADVHPWRSDNTWIIDSEFDPVPAVYYGNVYASGNSTNTNVINTKNVKKVHTEDADITVWYYLDVLVQDESGNPVESAKVTVTHPNVTVDYYNIPLNVTPINLHIIPREYTEGILDPKPITTVYTGAKGHTSLPSDADNTLVIADYRMDHHGQPYYSYPIKTTNFNNWIITAEKDGVSATATGINPDASWYREDPNTYPGEGKGTVVITLPTTVETGNISGTVKDTSNNPIQGATVSDGTRSATTTVDGTYTISSVPAGTYTVTAEKAGYQPASQSGVVVTEGATTTVNFVLTPTIKGDLNSDGKVNSLDYSLLVGKWFQTTGITLQDLNKDGKVNVRDLGIMMSNWKE